MPDLKLDHLFIITEPGAAAADSLKELGWAEGPSNSHPGQGTANRRFFFHGFTLELLFIRDALEAANGAGRKLGILERSENSTASPVGLVARVSDKSAKPIFPNWQYFPDYFSGNLCFHVGENSNALQEPLCICMPPLLPEAKPLPAEYANNGWQLTNITMSVPVTEQSSTLVHFSQMDNVQIVNGSTQNVCLKFNEGRKGESVNFADALPLVIAW